MDGRIIVAVCLIGILLLVGFAISALPPQSFPYSKLTGVPQTFPYGNLTSVPNIDLMHGLCLWLPFDGVALDKSGYSSVLTVNSVSFVAGRFFNCSLFNSGSGSYISIASSVLTDFYNSMNYTVSLWFKSGFSGCLISEYGSVYPLRLVLQVGGVVDCYEYNGSSALLVEGSGVFNDDSWHFLVYEHVFGGYCSLFIDGLLKDAELSLSGNTFNGGVLWFGCRYSGSNHYSGLLDDVRLYNRVLSDFEISALYTLGV